MKIKVTVAYPVTVELDVEPLPPMGEGRYKAIEIIAEQAMKAADDAVIDSAKSAVIIQCDEMPELVEGEFPDMKGDL